MAAPVDDFNDNSFDTAKWAVPTVRPIPYDASNANFPAGGSFAETGGELVFSPNAGWVGISSFDTAINASNTDKFIKLTDFDLANMGDGDRILFGFQRSDATRYAFFELARSGGTVAGEWLYLGRGGYIGNAPSTFTYNTTDHVWLKIRQFSGSNNDIAWSVAPAGSGVDTPGTWTEQRRLSTEAGWAGHLSGGTPTAMTPALEGVWVRRAGGSGWNPKIDNYGFVSSGITITAGINESNDTLSSSVTNQIVTTAAISEEVDTVASNVAITVSLTSALSETDDVLSSEVDSSVGIVASIDESDDTLSSVLTSLIAVNAAIVEDFDALVSSISGPGTTLISAELVESPDSLVSTLISLLNITSSITEQSDTNTSIVLVAVVCSADLIEQADQLVSTIRDAVLNPFATYVFRCNINSQTAFDLGLVAIRADGTMCLIL